MAAPNRSTHAAPDPAWRSLETTLQPYVLSCDREPLNSRLGPADFYPPSSNDPELKLTQETVTVGYKEEIANIDESREVLYSLVSAQALWTKQSIHQCRSVLRARFKAFTNALARRRKVGQVFGVPLAGLLLARAGAHPELKGPPLSEDWLVDLSSTKPLHQLADSAPQGLHGARLIEALVRARAPLVRATWLVKACYLGQVRPLQVSGLSGGVQDKSQGKRTDLWTRVLLAFLDNVLEGGTDKLTSKPPTATETEERWQQLVPLLLAHYGEGLVNAATVVDWALRHFADISSARDDVSGPGKKVQMLLPVVLALLEGLLEAQTQKHLQELTKGALAWLERLNPGGGRPSKLASGGALALKLAELVRYVHASAPDSFVGAGVLPLPECVLRCEAKEGEEMLKQVQARVMRKRASLAAAVNPVVLRSNEARVVTALDNELLRGDIDAACAVFDDPLVGGEGELTAVIGLVCNWAICRSGYRPESIDSLLEKRTLTAGESEEQQYPLVAELERSEPPPQPKAPSVSDSVKAKDSKGLSDYFARSRVYMAASVLRRLSQARSAFTPGQCHMGLCNWLLGTQAAGVNDLQELLLAQLSCMRLFDRILFARNLVAAGTLLQHHGARVHSCREILQQLPEGEEQDSFAMETRAALAIGRKRKQIGSGTNAAEEGLGSIKRCISSLLNLPNPMREDAVGEAIKKQRTKREGERKVDWWWLMAKGMVEVTQRGESLVEGEKTEVRTADASETKDFEERQNSDPWSVFEGSTAGLSYPQKQKVGSWLLKRAGLDRRRLKEVGWEEDVRWREERHDEQPESTTMEVDEEKKGKEGRVWELDTTRLLCVVNVLDSLGQHQMLVDVLLGLLVAGDPRRDTTIGASIGAEPSIEASGLQREGSFAACFSTGCLLALLQRYAPLIASMDRLPQLLSGLAKRASVEKDSSKSLAEFVCHLRSKYGTLTCSTEWERSAREALGAFWAEVDRAAASGRETRLALGRNFETLRKTYRSMLEAEEESLARLLGGRKGVRSVEELAKAMGKKLGQQQGEGVESVAARIAALVEIAADNQCEGDLQKQQQQDSLAFCAAFIESFGSSFDRRAFSEGVALALAHIVQEQVKKATNPSAPFHKMSPETPDLGSTTLPDTQGIDQDRTVLALALSVTLISRGTLSLSHMVGVLQLEDTLKGGDQGQVATSRAALRWLKLLLGGASKGDETNDAARALIGGPCFFFVARDLAQLPLEALYTVTWFLLRVSQTTHFEPEAKSALLEVLKGPLMSDAAGLYELIRSDTWQQETATKLDERRKSGELASWQEAASELLPLQGTFLLKTLSEGTVVEREVEKSVEELEADIVEALLDSLEGIHTGNFQWGALEVRLLLADQVVLEKLRGGSSAKDALASLRSQCALSESEKAFTTAVLTRLLTRPDAAPLYSQLAQILGREFSDYLIQQVRWALEGSDMLQGRKSLRQLLEASAMRDGFRIVRARAHAAPFALERALAELVLPCLAGSSSEVCAGFAAELVKQLAALEATMGGRVRASAPDAASRTRADAPAWGRGLESSPRSGGGQWGSAASSAQTPPASTAALQTSVWLRLQFVLPMLPQIHADRDPSPRNMRLTFAPVLLRLLASPVIYNSASPPPPDDSTPKNKHHAPNLSPPKGPNAPEHMHASNPLKDKHAFYPPRDAYAEAAAAAAAKNAGESLFDRLLAVLHALMSATWQEWLKPLPGKGAPKVLRDVGPFDRATAERMQAELDALRPNLPASVFRQLQSALPILLPPRCTIPSISAVKSPTKGTSFSSEGGDCTVEVDPWLLLEEGATGGHGPSNHVAPKAAAWLKGAIRVPRKELTYGPKEVEEDLE